MATYYPGQDAANEAGTLAMGATRSRSQSPKAGRSPQVHQSPRHGLMSPKAGSPAGAISGFNSPSHTGVFSTIPLSTIAGDDTLSETDMEKGSASPVRLRYLTQAGMNFLGEKLRKQGDIGLEDLERLAQPELLGDSEKLVPVHLDATWHGGISSAVASNGGARGAALSLLAARDKAEAARAGETLSAKEWRTLMREADGVLKPYLLAFIVLTALGSGTLLTLAMDASRRFLLLLTIPHVGSEVMLLTYFLFGAQPYAADAMWKPRFAIRALYVFAVIVIACAPLRSDGLVGPVSVWTHIGTAALADATCLWLGLFLCFERLDVASRRLGGGLFCHGLVGLLGDLEFLNPGLFSTGSSDMQALRGWGFILMILGTAMSLRMIIPIFAAQHLDMRSQHPQAKTAIMVCVLALLTVMCLPFAAGNVPDLQKEPTFLPRGHLLAIYKMVASIGGIALAVHAVTEFNLHRQRPLSPTLATFVGSEIWRSLQWVD